jgi:Sec-independent protein translocase protein TatA
MNNATDPQWILLGFNVVLGIAAFFGGMVMRDVSASIKELRKADKEMAESLRNYATKDELKESRTETRETLKEMRDEQRDSFQQVFQKLDSMTQQIAQKADR